MRNKTKFSVNNFVGGLITDAHELNSPQNTTADEDNCDLDRKGFRRRRQGLTYETGYAFNTATSTQVLSDLYYMKAHKWKSVANQPNLQYLVVQIGNILYFYDRSFDPISGGQKSFTVNLDTFKTVAAAQTYDKGIQVASGKGVLFVVGEAIEPFYITYNPDLDTITSTQITIQMRDLKLQDTTTAYDARPTSLTDALKYDLYNQGWGYAQAAGNDSIYYGSVVATNRVAIEYYLFATSHYPPRSKPWWIGKRSAVDPGEAGFSPFDPNGVYDNVFAGNTLAPLGHYILDAFHKDRTTASGIGSFPIEIETTRPTAVAFFGGHVFFGHKNTVYYSPLLTDDLTIVGQCYQQADPTSEDINDLIATDGGVILMPTSGQAVAFMVKDNSLVCMYDNGIWAVSGTTAGDSFSATGHGIVTLTMEGVLSSRSVIEVEGDLCWWGRNGIFVLGSSKDGSAQGLSISSLTDNKIQNLYDSIIPIAKEFATGAYDKIRKRIVWLYNNATSLDSSQKRFYYNRVLNFDMLKSAFFPYTISDLGVTQPSHLIDVFNLHTVKTATTTENVVDSTGVVVTAADASNVTVSRTVYQNVTTLSSDLKYLVTGPTVIQSPLVTSLLCPQTNQNNVPVTANLFGTTGWTFFGASCISCLMGFDASFAQCVAEDLAGRTAFTMPYLRCSNFGLAVPAAATITGVEVRIGIDTNAETFKFYERVNANGDIRLASGASAGTVGTSNLALDGVHLPGSGGTLIKGGNGELWGLTMTPAVVNSTDFSVLLRIQREWFPGNPANNSRSATISLNAVQVRVFYRL